MLNDSFYLGGRKPCGFYSLYGHPCTIALGPIVQQFCHIIVMVKQKSPYFVFVIKVEFFNEIVKFCD